MLDRWFLEHPRSVDETYLEHQRMAWRFSASLLKAAAACFVHGLVPALFSSTASRTVDRLHEEMLSKRLPRRAPQNGNLQSAPPGGIAQSAPEVLRVLGSLQR